MRILPALLVLLALAVGGLAAFAWHEAGVDRYAGLEVEGRALAGVLKANALDASENVKRAERAVEGRLRAAAKRASSELEWKRTPRAEVLAAVAKEDRVSWIAYVDADGLATVARWPAPIASMGVDPALREDVEQEAARDDAKRLALAAGEMRVEGLIAANAFGADVARFGVAYGRPEGGVLLLRAKEELADVRRRFGLGPALARVASAPGVVRASLLDATGRVLADGRSTTEEAGYALPSTRDGETVEDLGGTLRVTAVFTPPEATAPYAIDLALSTLSADDGVDRSRRAILVGTALVAAVSIAAAAALAAVSRRHDRAKAALEARRDEDRRLADMGALASLFTHEMSNPLNALRLGFHLLDGGSPPPGIVETMKGQADRMAATLEQFLALARGRRTGLAVVDATVLDRVAARIAPDAEAKRVRVVVDAAPAGSLASGDPYVVEHALSALARNAVEASPQGETVRIRWTAADDGGALVTISDRGDGFPKDGREDLARLGRTGRPGGHGIGLALAKRFLEAEGGSLALEDGEGGGAVVRVHLPPPTAGAAP